MERRLAAIIAADVVGYSRLIRADEEGTIVALKALRADLVDPKIAEHNGRIVKLMGDGMLAEFASVVDAVRAAVETQQAVAERNASLPEDKRIEFRVGVNLGDVIIDGDDIQGDGVNVAARLEGLAPPGGICVSGSVHEQVRDRIDLAFEDLGEQKVKNIDRPVRVWRWVDDDEAALAGPPGASEPLPLPDKPSIAVLPFDNLSGDPEQEFFTDGIAEDLLTNLSRIQEMFVIARNSSFAYKGQSPDLRTVAAELGVRYVLEGSVRRSGRRVRITVQLIDGIDGSHVWAERYDRDLGDLFELQDEITSEIATTLQVRLTEGQQARIRRSRTKSYAAWEKYQQALTHFRRFTRGEIELARELIERALANDPEFVSALALKAWCHVIDARLAWTNSAEAALTEGIAVIERAQQINREDADVVGMLGLLRLMQGRFDEADEASKQAIQLNPNSADQFVIRALILNMRGQPNEALALIENAMRLCPVYPDWYLGIVAISYRLLGRYEEAIAADLERLRRNPENGFSDIRLAAVNAELGDLDKARYHVQQSLKKQPDYRLRHLKQTDRYEDPKAMRAYENLLRQAGLPE